jgi:hypothetical protein
MREPMLFYLFVEQTVPEGNEHALESGQEVRGIRPQGELPHPAHRRAEHTDDIGHAKQRQQDYGPFYRFPAKKEKIE